MSKARIRWISGPLLRAQSEQPFGLHEAVRVGAGGMLGEVIRIHGDEITAQVYEDTTGLRFGDPVTGDGCPLSVRLSPGLLGGIFDGLLRPLSDLETPFIPRGARRLSQRIFAFEPGLIGLAIEGGSGLAAVLPEELVGAVQGMDDPRALSYFVAANTRMDVEDAQRFLELESCVTDISEAL